MSDDIPCNKHISHLKASEENLMNVPKICLVPQTSFSEKESPMYNIPGNYKYSHRDSGTFDSLSMGSKVNLTNQIKTVHNWFKHLPGTDQVRLMASLVPNVHFDYMYLISCIAKSQVKYIKEEVLDYEKLEEEANDLESLESLTDDSSTLAINVLSRLPLLYPIASPEVNIEKVKTNSPTTSTCVHKAYGKLLTQIFSQDHTDVEEILAIKQLATLTVNHPNLHHQIQHKLTELVKERGLLDENNNPDSVPSGPIKKPRRPGALSPLCSGGGVVGSSGVSQTHSFSLLAPPYVPGMTCLSATASPQSVCSYNSSGFMSGAESYALSGSSIAGGGRRTQPPLSPQSSAGSSCPDDEQVPLSGTTSQHSTMGHTNTGGGPYPHQQMLLLPHSVSFDPTQSGDPHHPSLLCVASAPGTGATSPSHPPHQGPGSMIEIPAATTIDGDILATTTDVTSDHHHQSGSGDTAGCDEKNTDSNGSGGSSSSDNKTASLHTQSSIDTPTPSSASSVVLVTTTASNVITKQHQTSQDPKQSLSQDLTAKSSSVVTITTTNTTTTISDLFPSKISITAATPIDTNAIDTTTNYDDPDVSVRLSDTVLSYHQTPQPSTCISNATSYGQSLHNLASSISTSSISGNTERNMFKEKRSGMSNVPCWLKSLRLHKYAGLFQSLTYEEMLSITDEWLDSKNVTKGARNKILVNIQKLESRQCTLRQLEQDLAMTPGNLGCLRACILEIRHVLSTPIKPVPGVASSASSCAEEFSRPLHHFSALSGVAPTAGAAVMAGDVVLGDLPGQIIRCMSRAWKIYQLRRRRHWIAFLLTLTLPRRKKGRSCSQLLVNCRADEELYSHFSAAIDSVLEQDAFSGRHKNLCRSWRLQLEFTKGPPPLRPTTNSNSWRGSTASILRPSTCVGVRPPTPVFPTQDIGPPQQQYMQSYPHSAAGYMQPPKYASPVTATTRIHPHQKMSQHPSAAAGLGSTQSHTSASLHHHQQQLFHQHQQQQQLYNLGVPDHLKRQVERTMSAPTQSALMEMFLQHQQHHQLFDSPPTTDPHPPSSIDPITVTTSSTTPGEVCQQSTDMQDHSTGSTSNIAGQSGVTTILPSSDVSPNGSSQDPATAEINRSLDLLAREVTELAIRDPDSPQG